MANGNKHRTLVPLATFAGEAGIEKLSFRGGEFCLFTPAWDRGKNEIVIFSASKDFQLEHFKVKILASVAFDEIEIIRNKPAIGILDELVGKVDGIVGAMEAELRRIRLIS
jgi:hypothetical protein